MESNAEVPVSLAAVMRLLQQQNVLLQAQGTEIAQLKAARQATVPVAAVIPPLLPHSSGPADGAHSGEDPFIPHDAHLREAIAAIMHADPPRHPSPPVRSDLDDDVRSQASSQPSHTSRASAVL